MRVIRERLRSLPLGVRFALISFVLVVALAVCLVRLLSGLVADRALEQAEQSVDVAVRLGLQPQLTPDDFVRGFDPARLSHVAESLNQARGADRVHDTRLDATDPVRIKVFNREGVVVYSDDRSLIGRAFTSADVAAALRGDVVSQLTDLQDEDEASERQYSRLLEVYVPVTYEADGRPVGVMEVYLPYQAVEASIRQDTLELTAALVLGLALVFLALSRLVLRASRRIEGQTRELSRQADENLRLATHDGLTGLPNRTLLLDRLGQALALAAREGGNVSVAVIDLDRFKEVNDTLGHHYGDRLLIEVGSRLRSRLRDVDTVARLAGDEFAVVLGGLDRPEEAWVVAQRLLDALHMSFVIDGVSLDLEASVGLACSPDDGATVDDLLRSADLAMYEAKESKAGVVRFEAREHVDVPDRLVLLGDLRRALEAEDQLFLVYQPKVSLDDGRPLGMEALLRWRHPERGLVMPNDFIPIAEGTGLITHLTHRVLGIAVRQVAAWQAAGDVVPVAVNLSTRCLFDRDLPTTVRKVLHAHGVDPALLTLEITETAVMHDPARSTAILRELHGVGVRLSLDDFGSGYTSMAQLEQLPLDELKIDRVFIAGMTDGRVHREPVLVRTAVDLGHNFGLTVVAEGVEQEQTVDQLRLLGCDIVQGYHFARPMASEDVPDWLRARAATPALSSRSAT